MIGICVAAQEEWNEVLKYYNKNKTDYFTEKINNKEVIFYRTGCGKENSYNSNKKMIEKYNLKKIIAIGSCIGIDNKLKTLDIIIPNKAVQFDYTYLEKNIFKVDYTIVLDKNKNYTIATSDVPILKKEISDLLYKNNIDIADMEAAPVAKICNNYNIECVIIKGISDFIGTNQISEYDKNVPIVMNKIMKEYLKKVI